MSKKGGYRQIRLDADGQIDEVVLDSVDVHLEYLDGDKIWLGLADRGGHTLHLYLSVQRTGMRTRLAIEAVDELDCETLRPNPDGAALRRRWRR